MPNKLPKRLFNVKTMETVTHDFPKSVLEDGYAAVSHVWGEQEWHNPEDLDIKGGVNWKVPLSNTRKMDMLKLVMKKFKMEWCWWDVLCMPQGPENQHLVNKEIPYMGNYYNGAKITIVLSDDEKVPEDRVERLITKGFFKGFTTIAKYTSVTMQIAMSEEKTWFERLWTFQEAVMSKQIWLVNSLGNLTDISDIMERLVLSNERLGVASSGDEIIMMKLARAIADYRDYKTSVGRMLYECCDRKCYKPEDKFYGVLGVLGYTDFPVKYGIDMKDLMRKFMEYAYDKEDVSWLAIHNNGKTGFIPSHENITYIGELWREENPGCDIKFKESTLVINGCITANVTHCHDISDMNMESSDIYNMCEGWELDESDVVRGITGHWRLSDGEVNCLKDFRRYNGDDVEVISLQGMKAIGNAIIGGDMTKLMAKYGRHTTIKWKMASRIVCMKTGKAMLITVCGDCDVGDKIMLLPMYDSRGRTLGIVVDDNFVRKGICLYPKLDDISYEYTPYEFQL